MMTEFQKEMAKKRLRWQKREEERIGDVYAECERRGCDRGFLKSFNTRIEMYPIQQTKAFLRHQEWFMEYLSPWRIYLEVLIELRPNHEKHDEWGQSIKEMDKCL